MDNVDDLDLLWCTECQRCHGPDCPILGPLVQINDTPILTHAVATLPASLTLHVGKDRIRQVVVRDTIANRTQFGPIEGPHMDLDAKTQPVMFLLKIFQKDGTSVTLDQSDENKCNWMCLVRPATYTDHQNLIVYQYKGALYYSAIQTIVSGTELRVWYAPHYAPKMRQQLLAAKSICISGSNNEVRTLDTVVDVDSGDSNVAYASKKGTADDTNDGNDENDVTVDNENDDDKDENDDTTLDNDNDDDNDEDDNTLVNVKEEDDANNPKLDTSRKSQCKTKTWMTLSDSSSAITQNSQQLMESNQPVLRKRSPVQRVGIKNIAKPVVRRIRRSRKMSRDNNEDNSNSTIGTCPICRKEYTNDELKDHLSQHRSTEGVDTGNLEANDFKCNFCLVPFDKKSNLVKHYATCKDSKDKEHNTGMQLRQRNKGKSSNCVQRSTGKESPLKKIRAAAKHTCIECNLKCTSLRLLQKHQKEAHQLSNVTGDKPKQQCLVNTKVNKQSQDNNIKRRQAGHGNLKDKSKQKCVAIKKDAQNVQDKTSWRSSRRKHLDALKCNECSECFKTEIHLCKHLLTNHSVRQFSCKFCSKIFSRKASLHNHRLTHMKVVTDGDGKKSVLMVGEPKDSMFKCMECSCMFQKWDSFKKHLSSLHSDVGLHFCDVCCSTHSSREDLYCHMAAHEKTELPDLDSLYTCDICNSLFYTLSKFKHHKNQHDGRRDYVCETCGKAFSRSDTLQRHKSKHEGKRKTCMCVRCGKMFQDQTCLSYHMRLHTDTAYTCGQCGRSFTQLGNYNQHLRTHAQQHQFKCQQCGSGFNHAQSLKRHSYIHMSKVDKIHKCDYCGRCFNEKYSLVKHVQDLHLMKRACHCEHCGQYIKRTESYYRHMRRRHANIAFEDYKPLKVSSSKQDEVSVAVTKINSSGELDIEQTEEKPDRVKEREAGGCERLVAMETVVDNTKEVREVKQRVKGHSENASESVGSERDATNNGFSRDGELFKALSKLKHTISKVACGKSSQNDNSLSADIEEVPGSQMDIDSRDGKEDNKESAELPVYMVVESHNSCSPETAMCCDKSEVITGDIQDVIVQSDNNSIDPDLLMVNLPSIDALMTLNASSMEEDPSSAVFNQSTSEGQTIAPVPGEQITATDPCTMLTSTVEETIHTSVSPGPMLGNRSLVSLPNESEMQLKQLISSSRVKTEASITKSTTVNSFISIESLLALPPSTSSSIPFPITLYNNPLVTQNTSDWQASSSSHGNNQNSNFMPGVNFSIPLPPKQLTNFSNVSSLAMPSTKSNSQRFVSIPHMGHQPVGTGLSFPQKSVPVTSLSSLQQSTSGMQQYVPIVSSLTHSTPATSVGECGDGINQLSAINLLSHQYCGSFIN